MHKLNKGMLLTPSKASEIYGIKKGKFYQWIRQKRFPYVKPQKELLFWQADFLEFIDSNTVEQEKGNYK
jgi:excisionase family DNA binding protein